MIAMTTKEFRGIQGRDLENGAIREAIYIALKEREQLITDPNQGATIGLGFEGRWEKGKPIEPGYYLVASESRDDPPQLYVLELWYNPDAKPKWWYRSGNPKPGVFQWQDSIKYWVARPKAPEET